MSVRSLVIFVFLAIVCCPAKADEPVSTKVTFYRDTWGVPHVYADTPAAGAYGLGYAQAEDRLPDVFMALRTGLGRMSEAFGPDWVDQDYIMRLVRNEEMAREQWEHASPELRELAEGFVAGLNAYMKDHPDRVPPSKLNVEPWQLATIGRAMILRWPLGQIQDEVGRRPQGENVPMRSNEWSIAPKRSADGAAILLADPHLDWEGLSLLYEARVHAGALEMSGFFLIGSPLMGYGHNAHVGWALTTGGPDTADVYEIKTQQVLVPQYEYDGKWRPCEYKVIDIPVKDAKNVKRPALYTHLGPVVVAPDKKTGLAYVAASPYFTSAEVFEQFYRMNMARDGAEFRAALGMNQFNEQNVMYADTAGNIGYVRTGRVPVRPAGYDWTKPVPGLTSATAWTGIHSQDDLVQILNPPQGYMQNCNVSPANMMLDSPLQPGKYPEYIFNVSWDTMNPRGERSIQLLSGDDSVTTDEAIAFATDVYDVNAPAWQDVVKRIAALPSPSAELTAATKALLSWDGRFSADATATVLYMLWRLKCDASVDGAKVFDTNTPDAAELGKMRDLLVKTIGEMNAQYKKWQLPWSEVHLLGRGDVYVGAAGAEFGSKRFNHGFSESLFDVRSTTFDGHPGQWLANSGTMSPILMFFTPQGVRSYSCVCWGQSGDPASAHFMDQGEKLYSQLRLKPTWWSKEELLQHLGSEKVLEIQ